MNLNEIQVWRAGLRQVAARRAAEVSEMSDEEKARSVSRMMDTQVSDRWAAKREIELHAIRHRWARLREILGHLE